MVWKTPIKFVEFGYLFPASNNKIMGGNSVTGKDIEVYSEIQRNVLKNAKCVNK